MDSASFLALTVNTLKNELFAFGLFFFWKITQVYRFLITPFFVHYYRDEKVQRLNLGKMLITLFTKSRIDLAFYSKLHRLKANFFITVLLHTSVILILFILLALLWIRFQDWSCNMLFVIEFLAFLTAIFEIQLFYKNTIFNTICYILVRTFSAINELD